MFSLFSMKRNQNKETQDLSEELKSTRITHSDTPQGFSKGGPVEDDYLYLLQSGDLKVFSNGGDSCSNDYELMDAITKLLSKQITHPFQFKPGHYLEFIGVRDELTIRLNEIVRVDGSIFKVVNGSVGLNLQNNKCRFIYTIFNSCTLAYIPVDTNDSIVKKILKLDDNEIKKLIPFVKAAYKQPPKYSNDEIIGMFRSISN